MDICRYKIKYADLTSGEHRIDMSEFAKSLQGFAGVFTEIGRLLKYDKVTVETDAEIKPGSIDIWAIISSVQQAAADISGMKELYDTVTAYVFSKRERPDMDKVLDVLKAQMASQHEEHMQQTAARHEEAMKALEIFQRQMDKPCRCGVGLVGKNCASIQISDSEDKVIARIDKETRNYLLQKPKDEVVSTEMEMEIVLREMDLTKMSCKFCMNEEYQMSEEAEPQQYKAVIQDPDVNLPGNRYTKSFSEQKPLRVSVKIQKSSAGSKYFIMDAF